MDHKISIELSVADLREMIANVRNMDEAALNGLLSLLATTGKTAEVAAPVAAPVKEDKPKVTIRESSNYFPLFKHLRDSQKEELAMSFADVAKIIGAKKLPASATKYASWWGNNLKKRTGQSKSWLDAGYQAHSVDLDKKTIKFRKY